MEGQPLIERGEFGIFRSPSNPYRFNVYHMLTEKFVRGGFTLEGALEFIDREMKGLGDIPTVQASLLGARAGGLSVGSSFGMGGGIALRAKKKDPYAEIPMIKKIMQEKGYL